MAQILSLKLPSRRYSSHWSAEWVGYTQGSHFTFGGEVDRPRKFPTQNRRFLPLVRPRFAREALEGY
jgi:hypothetical protein